METDCQVTKVSRAPKTSISHELLLPVAGMTDARHRYVKACQSDRHRTSERPDARDRGKLFADSVCRFDDLSTSNMSKAGAHIGRRS